ncbi:TetR/AcrR family transcriptional regulator [Sciscionella sediminilitoris]|uniref:TetR/AcrR family transcriptional regulator n=1 Tax=Sciscionella sediminilitoris TaxID=1445613 RepID=UPI001E30ACD8|nr:TetR/AcrR family transcriptional regulator [Sciscionella sp. SE31]
MPGGYHHGQLREALVRAGLELLAERGVTGFSVAELARRAGVSPAAPYRHFASKDDLFAAVALVIADQLIERVRAAVEAQTDPVEKLAHAAGAYTEYFARTRAGLHVLVTEELRAPNYPELHERSREFNDLFLNSAFAVSSDAQSALALMEQVFAQAHGYAAFYLDGVFPRYGAGVAAVAAKSVDAARVVIESYRDRG